MIKDLQIKNWKCHENLYLEFKEGVNFIIGDNGIGKTSLLEALVFGLIGRVRAKPNKNFKKIGSTEDSVVSINFELNNKKYKIIRNLKGKKFTRLASPIEKNLTDPKDMNQFILDLFNSNQAFLENILFSPEGETYEFMKLDQEELINYLEKLIGIGKTREFRSLVSNLLKFFENKKKENEKYIKRLQDFEFKEDLGDKIQLEGDQKLLLDKLNSLKIDIRGKKEDISRIKKRMEEKNIRNYDYKMVLSKTQKKYNQNKNIFLDLNIDEFSIQKLLSNKERIVNIANDYSTKLKIKVREINDKEKKILEKEISIEEKNKIKDIIDKLKINYNMEIRVVCPLCKKDLSKKEFLQIHKDTNNEIDDLKNETNNYNQEIKDYQKQERNLEYKYKSYEELAELLESISSFDDHIIIQAERFIREYNMEINQIENDLKKIEGQQNSLEKKLKEVEGKLRDIKAAEKVKDVMKYDEKYREYLKGTLICDITIDAVDKILNKQRNLNLDDVINEIEKIWKIFFPFEERSLYFNKNYIPYFEKNGDFITFDNASAGEKMILLILIKTILLKKYTKIPFLFLDEPLEHLNFENRIHIINYLVDICKKGLIKQLIITTFEESLTRKFRNLEDIHIISLPNLKKYTY